MPVARIDCRQRGCRHQLSPTFPRSPGIIPVAFSTFRFRSLHCDCSIKEQDQGVNELVVCEDIVLRNFCTTHFGE